MDSTGVRTSEPGEPSMAIPSISSSATTHPLESSYEILATADDLAKGEMGSGLGAGSTPPSPSPHDSEGSSRSASSSGSSPPTSDGTDSSRSINSICTGAVGGALGAEAVVPGESTRSHRFAKVSRTLDLVGKGSYGFVYCVQCMDCERHFAKKDIFLDPGSSRDLRQKFIENTESELICYQRLRHPHVVGYVHHERTDSKVSIYTEYCRLKDLQRILSKTESGDKGPAFAAGIGEAFAWDILEALASALSRCHMGLNASKENGSALQYTTFEDGWKSILHRDIKPENILLAVYTSPGDGDKPIAKLGDFGTSHTLSDQALSSRPAGTRDYWSTELAEEAKTTEERTTKWSMQSDIWAVGAVIHRMLTKTTPKQEQEKDFEPRLNIFKSKVTSAGKSASKLLSHIITSCIDPSPEGRPSALQLLSVAVKHDSSPIGCLRSESFWAAVSKHPNRDVISSVVEKFADNFLPLLAESRTKFSPKEVVFLMSLIKEHCPHLISGSHPHLCAGRELAGENVFHVMAQLSPEDAETATYALETSRWPHSLELSHLVLQTRSDGLLPSAVAAWKRNRGLHVQLAHIENTHRSRTKATEEQNLRKKMEQEMALVARNEFEVMYKFLCSSGCALSIRPSQAFTVLEKTARLGYTNIVRKLIDMGIINSSTRGKRNETALHIFAYTGNRALVSLLKGNEWDINAEDKDKRTPLHWAAWADQRDTVEELLRLEANVNAQDKLGRTPLYGAAGGGFKDVVQKLLGYRADRSIRGGKDKETPLDRARQKGHQDVVSLLERGQTTQSH